MKITDNIFGPPVSDTAKLVAGTFGFSVEEGDRAPVVEAKQGWMLLLPKGSPVIARMKGCALDKQSLRNDSVNRETVIDTVMPEGQKTLGVPVVIGGDNLPSPVEIGLADLPNIGGASGPTGPPGSGFTVIYINERA